MKTDKKQSSERRSMDFYVNIPAGNETRMLRQYLSTIKRHWSEQVKERGECVHCFWHFYLFFLMNINHWKRLVTVWALGWLCVDLDSCLEFWIGFKRISKVTPTKKKDHRCKSRKEMVLHRKKRTNSIETSDERKGTTRTGVEFLAFFISSSMYRKIKRTNSVWQRT